MNLFVIDLTYTADLAEVDKFLEPHRAFLKEHYSSEVFLASGPKNPRTGGVILARAASRAAVEAIVDRDPFRLEGIADYKITEFSPVLSVPGFPGGAPMTSA